MELTGPRPDEVLVEIVASGLCLWELHRGGHLPFERLITHDRLDQINVAAADCHGGDVVKPVLPMDQGPDDGS